MKALLSTLALLCVTTAAMANMTVQGTGKIVYVPDVGYVQVNVRGEGKTAAEAWEKNRDILNVIFEALHKQGIDKKDLQTTNLNVSPRYFHPKTGEPVLVGYTVSYDLKVTVRKLDDMGKVLDDMVASGANRHMSISFGCSNLDELVKKARKAAAADARERAELYASGSGATLGHVVSLADTHHAYLPRIAYEHAAPISAGRDLPIAPGEQEVSVNVTVVYSLLPVTN